MFYLQLNLNNMLEVSELVFALLDRQKKVNDLYSFEDENNPSSTKAALNNLIEQVRTLYPYMFPY
jgi:hypothetical protein